MRYIIKNVYRKDHLCYLIFSASSNRTYVGYTNDFRQRIRRHNRKISGGAKYTSNYGPWKLAILVSGFQNKKQALQFEWAVKHSGIGKQGRVDAIFKICRKERWTKKSPQFVPLTIHVFKRAFIYVNNSSFVSKLPKYISVEYYR